MADPHLSTAPGTDVEAATEDAAVVLRPGLLIGRRYRLVDQLGEGAMGEVWRAEHEELHIEVALKFVGADALSEMYQERFRFEAQVAAQISRRSPHVVAVNDAGTHRGRPYLVMDLVDGRSVDDLIYDDGTMSVDDVETMLFQVGGAIDVAHEAGVFHRDVKPANILMQRHGDRLDFKLADFGVAKMHAEVLALDAPTTTQQGHLVGTPAYMSPSQFTGLPVDAGVDRWALAVVAYEALTQRLPFQGETASAIFSSIMRREYARPTSIRPDLPAGLEGWFSRAWSEDETGFTSGEAMAEAFAAARKAEVLAPSEPPVIPTRRSSVWPAVIALGALGVLLGGWWLAGPSDETTNGAERPPVTPDAPSEPAAATPPSEEPEPVASAPTAVQPETHAPPRPLPEPTPQPHPQPPSTPKTAPAPQPPPPPSPKVVPKNEIL